MTAHSNDTTHFGYKNVQTAEKSSLVKGVFNSVAGKYDIMNDVMSLGAHRLWKKYFVKTINPTPGARLLDVAGGTGDIAFEWLRHSANAHISILDINEQMLHEGKNRAINKGHIGNIEWLCGDAESLPMPDQSVDYYTIAFGIRNVTHIDKALREAYRVLKTGGRFSCLEFSRVNQPVLRKLYDSYSFHIIPKLGSCLAGDADSYQYLVESIRKFPDQEHFKQLIGEAGFANVSYTNLSHGIVAIHSAWRI